jgi:hypothetical protein
MNTDPAVVALEEALSGRSDLNKHGSNKRLVFAAQLILGIDDIDTVAAEALTDGRDDKACDLVYVDRDAGLVVLAQGYEAENINRPAAPQKKVATLYQAVTWVFTHDLNAVPEGLRAPIAEVRSALDDGAVDEVKIWFVHNLPESKNIGQELNAIKNAVHSALTAGYPELVIDIHVEEIGRFELAEWYRSSRTPILVTEELTVPVDSCLITHGPAWEAFAVTVHADWLNGLYWSYQERLFSANVRGFLGSRRSKGNINNGIRETLLSEPDNFWVFNNGITALVDDVRYEREDARLVVKGLSIVNGAQTTGALANCGNEEVLQRSNILMRFIKCADPAVVRKIIRFNNRQNATEASDFRSNDRVQRRLVEEFGKLGISGYTGGRRGVDVSNNQGEVVDVTSAGQALAAFHGDPGIAYQEKRMIWENDYLYGRLFSSDTTAQHVLFCWSLLKAVGAYKFALRGLPEAELTKGKAEQRTYFERRGAIMLIVAAIAESVDALLGLNIRDRFELGFRGNPTPGECIAAWRPVVATFAPLAEKRLGPLLTPSGPPRELDREVLGEFRNHVEGIVEGRSDLRRAFSAQVNSRT